MRLIAYNQFCAAVVAVRRLVGHAEASQRTKSNIKAPAKAEAKANDMAAVPNHSIEDVGARIECVMANATE